jgi:hypothetical protein
VREVANKPSNVLLRYGATDPAMTAVAAEVAVAEPAELLAVTETRAVWPTSPYVKT